jgi:hypothetical protein
MTTTLRLILLLVPILGLNVNPSGIQRPPPAAMLYPNDCPHEPPCADSVWIAHQRLAAYTRLNDRSRRAFVVTVGQRLRFHRAFVVVDRPGLVVVTRSQSRYRAGDTVWVLGYEGEGDYRVWHRDTLLVIDPAALVGDSSRAKRLERPRFTWWAEVSTGAGRRGWLALRNTAEEGLAFDENLDMRPRPAPRRSPSSRPAG